MQVIARYYVPPQKFEHEIEMKSKPKKDRQILKKDSLENGSIFSDKSFLNHYL